MIKNTNWSFKQEFLMYPNDVSSKISVVEC
jgi:hypothetical protein